MFEEIDDGGDGGARKPFRKLVSIAFNVNWPGQLPCRSRGLGSYRKQMAYVFGDYSLVDRVRPTRLRPRACPHGNTGNHYDSEDAHHQRIDL
jgi:hypothetical protein